MKRVLLIVVSLLHGQLLFAPVIVPSVSSRPTGVSARPKLVSGKSATVLQFEGVQNSQQGKRFASPPRGGQVPQQQRVVTSGQFIPEKQVGRYNPGLKTAGDLHAVQTSPPFNMKLIEVMAEKGSPVAKLVQRNSLNKSVTLTPARSISRSRSMSNISSPVQAVKSDIRVHKVNQQKSSGAKYDKMVELGNDRYKIATPDELRASINTSALGNARTVTVNPADSAARRVDAVDAIHDISAKVQVTGKFVDPRGQAPYRALRDSVEVFSTIAQDPVVRSSKMMKDKALDNLVVQRKSLGEGYQRSLNLLKSTATPDQIAQAEGFVKTKIGKRNSAEIFKDARVKDNYDVFVKDLVALRDGVANPTQLKPWLETKLNLIPGELSAPTISVATSMKLESLYQTLDLVALKKGAHISGASSQGIAAKTSPRLAHAEQLTSLMQGIKKIEPIVKTIEQNQLLKNSTNKQSILLTTQSDFMYTTMGRAMKELNSIQFAS